MKKVVGMRHLKIIKSVKEKAEYYVYALRTILSLDEI